MSQYFSLNSMTPDGAAGCANMIQAYLDKDKLQDYLPYPKQAEFHLAGRSYRNRMISAGNQAGKSLIYNTFLPTPHGMMEIGKLKVGDLVFGLDGKPTEVLGVYPQGVREIWKVTARDGTHLFADGEHLWGTLSSRGGLVVRTTNEMRLRMEARDRKYANAPKKIGGYYQLPLRPVVKYDRSELPLDPRLLGVILGDGCISREALEFHSADEWLVEDVREITARYGCNVVDYGRNLGSGGYGKSTGKARTYGITQDGSMGQISALGANPIKRIIREMGLWGKNAHAKYIPDEYKMSSVQHRLDILSGLMDTDGCAEKNGRRIFVTVSEKMARDVLEIIHSLGMNASIRLIDRQVNDVDRPIWRVHIHQGGFPLFRLPCKAEREREGWKAQKNMRIKSIEPAGEAECVCIKVAADDGMFLAGEGYLPTHNTYSSSAEVAMHLTGEYPKWWRGLKFNRPVVIWVGGETGETTRDIIQRGLLGPAKQLGTGMVPKRLIIPTMSAKTPGVPGLYDFIYIKHVTGGMSMLKFRYYSQERRKWQGSKVDFLWFDEEPPLEIYEEGLARTIASGGSTILSFTPLMGYTHVVNLYMKDPDPQHSGRHWTRMGLKDVQHLTEEDKARELSRWPKHQRVSRLEGLPAIGQGQIFPYEDSSVTVTPFSIPDHWPRLAGIDTASASDAPTAHPTAAIEIAWDRDNDTVYVIREHRKQGLKPHEHWLTLRTWGKMLRWAWPKDAMQHEKATGDQIIKVYKNEGMQALAQHAQFASKENRKMSVVSPERGIMEMQLRFEDGRLKIFDTCSMFLEEMRQYHRDKDGKIVKATDDLLDASRYCLMMLRFARVLKTRGAPISTGEPPDPLLGF